MRNIKYLLIHLMRLLTISLTLSRSNGILPGIIWGIHWSIIVLTYIVYHKDSLWKITVTFLIRPTLAITGIIFLLLFLYVLHPATGTSYMKRLPDEWGKKWFNLMLEDNECMESQDRFRAFFKGIAFIPDENGTCINGFQVNDSSFCITLYYHELKEKPTEQTLVFNASSSLNYTKVEHDRTGTPIGESLKAGTDYNLPSSESDHQVYLQG